MASTKRPRMIFLSGDAPTRAIDFGHSSACRFPIVNAVLTKAQTTGDDAAQDLPGPTLDSEFRRDQCCMVENLFKRRQCLWIAAVLRREFPSPRRQSLFPVGPQILDQCSFHLGHFACAEHAGDRQRHLAQGGKLGDQPAYSLGSPLVRRGAHGANERLDEQCE